MTTVGSFLVANFTRIMLSWSIPLFTHLWLQRPTHYTNYRWTRGFLATPTFIKAPQLKRNAQAKDYRRCSNLSNLGAFSATVYSTLIRGAFFKNWIIIRGAYKNGCPVICASAAMVKKCWQLLCSQQRGKNQFLALKVLTAPTFIKRTNQSPDPWWHTTSTDRKTRQNEVIALITGICIVILF